MNNIKILRKEKGLTVEELAKKIGVSKSSVSLWENGKTDPRMGQVQKMAEYFGVTKSYLLGIDDNYGSLLSEKSYIFNDINKLIEKEKLNDNFELVQMIGITQLIFKNLSTISEDNKRDSELSVFIVLLNRLMDISYTVSTEKIHGRITTNFSYSELVNYLNKNIGEINGLLQDSIRDIKAKYYKEMNDEDTQ